MGLDFCEGGGLVLDFLLGGVGGEGERGWGHTVCFVPKRRYFPSRGGAGGVRWVSSCGRGCDGWCCWWVMSEVSGEGKGGVGEE